MTEPSFSLFIIAGTVVFALLVTAIIVFLFQIQKKNQTYLYEKKLMKTQFQQALLQTQIEIQEQTLRTISQEIHDNVGQVLSLAKLNLNTIEPVENNKAKLSDTKNLISKAINDLRNLSRSLHGERIGDIGLQEAIENELKILQNTGQFETELNITGQAYAIDSQKEMVLFRIFQEASHNSVKHSNANRLTLTIDYKPGMFCLSIADNGRGFEANNLDVHQNGIGLKSMKNRTALIGGTFTINSSAEKGTNISIELKR
jgi:signal transduction histidine kinase